MQLPVHELVIRYWSCTSGLAPAKTTQKRCKKSSETQFKPCQWLRTVYLTKSSSAASHVVMGTLKSCCNRCQESVTLLLFPVWPRSCLGETICCCHAFLPHKYQVPECIRLLVGNYPEDRWFHRAWRIQVCWIRKSMELIRSLNSTVMHRGDVLDAKKYGPHFAPSINHHHRGHRNIRGTTWADEESSREPRNLFQSNLASGLAQERPVLEPGYLAVLVDVFVSCRYQRGMCRYWRYLQASMRITNFRIFNTYKYLPHRQILTRYWPCDTIPTLNTYRIPTNITVGLCMYWSVFAGMCRYVRVFCHFVLKMLCKGPHSGYLSVSLSILLHATGWRQWQMQWYLGCMHAGNSEAISGSNIFIPKYFSSGNGGVVWGPNHGPPLGICMYWYVRVGICGYVLPFWHFVLKMLCTGPRPYIRSWRFSQ